MDSYLNQFLVVVINFFESILSVLFSAQSFGGFFNSQSDIPNIFGIVLVLGIGSFISYLVFRVFVISFKIGLVIAIIYVFLGIGSTDTNIKGNTSASSLASAPTSTFFSPTGSNSGSNRLSTTPGSGISALINTNHTSSSHFSASGISSLIYDYINLDLIDVDSIQTFLISMFNGSSNSNGIQLSNSSTSNNMTIKNISSSQFPPAKTHSLYQKENEASYFSPALSNLVEDLPSYFSDRIEDFSDLYSDYNLSLVRKKNTNRVDSF
ncbi:MAG TPA: hypothetical protein PKA63_04885 [Oligoflexia bacterium]|nr:hypothetical protein [Oligoflexia bacterium]HMP47986.1 hypothetical protein [Oligoflexia bacterium]